MIVKNVVRDDFELQMIHVTQSKLLLKGFVLLEKCHPIYNNNGCPSGQNGKSVNKPSFTSMLLSGHVGTNINVKPRFNLYHQLSNQAHIQGTDTSA